MKWEVIKNIRENDFVRAFGVNFFVFRTLVEILEEEVQQRKYSGRPPLLSLEDQVLLTLLYLKEYVTFQVLGLIFGVSETTAYNVATKTEAILIKNNEFKSIANNAKKLEQPIENEDLNQDNNHLNSPNESSQGIEEQQPKHSQKQDRTFIVDATEVRRERPIVNQSEHYSGKAGDFTAKAQIIIDSVSGEIVHLAFANGKTHDYNLFKSSTANFDPSCHFIADAGYQGIEKKFENSFSPFKSYGDEPISGIQNQVNKILAKMRIKVEHTIREIKKFRIFSTRYRGKGNKFELRFTLVAELYNMRIC
jgi:hypothetical protein